MGRNETHIWQDQLEWFDKGEPSPDAETRRICCDPATLGNPFHDFVGNQHAVKRLCRVAFDAFGRYNHCCSDHSFGLIGPPSCGKTTLARLFGKLIRLPFVEVNARSVTSINDVAATIAEVCENAMPDNEDVLLGLQDLGDGHFVFPPMIILIDDVQALPKNVERDLGTAVGGTLISGDYTFDTTLVCWIVSITDESLLVDPFDRFTKIQMKPLTVEEVAQVVAIHNSDWKPDVCQLVAHQAGSLRDALTFANEMRIEFEMNGGEWLEVAEIVAKDWESQKSTPRINRLRRNGRN